MITPVYLCVLDGFGLDKKNNKTNAISLAINKGQAPFIADLFKNHSYAQLKCSGPAVGLPKNTMGNSEVNHLNMGAGRIVYQSIERINLAIKNKSFFTNSELLKATKKINNYSTVHLMGILQGHGGTVHGSIKHLFALLKMMKNEKVDKVYLHLFTDGRDTNPQAAGEIYLPMLEKKIKKLGLQNIVKIATIMGREIAMDRDTAWNKILIAMKAIVSGQGEFKALNAKEAIFNSYASGQTDEFIRPTIISDYHGINPNDSVIYFNFRQDRTIELTTAFCEQDKKIFNFKKGTKPIEDNIYNEIIDLQKKIKEITFVAMTEYYPGLQALTAFPEKTISDTVGEIVSKAGLKQLRLAGPEKFAHVTGWFSGRQTEPFPGEDRHLSQDTTLKEKTDEGKHYDLVPEMTAYLETEYSLRAIDKEKYSLIVHNFQNSDMIGHTGNLEAATKAISDLSVCLEKIVPAWLAKGGVFIITADHGNVEEMTLKKGLKTVVSTQHSLNPVPFWILGKKVKLKNKGIIPDIGVTVLDLIGLPIPPTMTAKTLLKK